MGCPITHPAQPPQTVDQICRPTVDLRRPCLLQRVKAKEEEGKERRCLVDGRERMGGWDRGKRGGGASGRPQHRHNCWYQGSQARLRTKGVGVPPAAGAGRAAAPFRTQRATALSARAACASNGACHFWLTVCSIYVFDSYFNRMLAVYFFRYYVVTRLNDLWYFFKTES